MASTSSKANIDLNDEENDFWSVYKCIFCNTQPDGNSKILECLHIACNNCILEKKTDSSVQCICQTVSNGQLTEFSIIPQNVQKIQSCSENNCCIKPERLCLLCEKHYCCKCSKEHLRNTSHNPSVMIVYPMETQFTLCTSCRERCVEVYCTSCSVIVCAFCHLNLHQRHDYVELEKLVPKIKTNLNRIFCELKKNDCFFNFCLDQNKKQIESLESIKKKLIEEETNKEIDKLCKKANERVLELQNLFDKDFLDSLTKINKMKQYLNYIKNKNKYCIHLIEALLKHNETSDIMELSKSVESKLQLTSLDNLLDKCILRLKNIKFGYDGTLEKCVSAITAVTTFSWNITPSSDHNLPNFVIVELPNNDSLTDNIPFENPNSETNFDADSQTSQLIFECICCKQRNEILIKCYYCNRHFHNDCHIPALPKNVELPKKWKCTMCRDIAKYYNHMLNFQEWNIVDNVPVHKYELKIIERILLELYCQNVYDNRIRTCLNKGIYPEFNGKVLRCTSLDDVKKRLESKQYTSLFNIINDVSQIFINALMYYPPSDPHYLAAFDLQTTFNSLITKWVPKFDLTKLSHV